MHDEIAPNKTLDSDSRGTNDNQLRRNPLARSAVNGVATKTQRGERERGLRQQFVPHVQRVRVASLYLLLTFC